MKSEPGLSMLLDSSGSSFFPFYWLWFMLGEAVMDMAVVAAGIVSMMTAMMTTMTRSPASAWKIPFGRPDDLVAVAVFPCLRYLSAPLLQKCF